MDELTGKQLGPYQIVAPLGEGGMAAVYKAYQPSVNRHVAVKVLPQYFARDPQFAARFEREAQVVAQLQHPNILPVFDYGVAEDASGAGGRYTYIAMPLIRGGSLETLMQARRLDYKTIRKIITQVGDALDYAHSRQLIHRDVKPANILIDERGNCLLTDFGLARMVEGTAKLTSSGAIMGTPAYMSPEQGRGWPLDRRTDVYSLGIILYELAVGRAPFEADTPMVVVVKHINDPLPLPSSLVPNFPAPLEQVIVKALEKDRETRYQTAGALVEAVNAAFDEIEAPAYRAPASNAPTSGQPLTPSVIAASPKVSTAVPPPAGTQSRIRRFWWVVPLVGLILFVGLIGLGGAGLFAFNLARQHTPTAGPTLTAPKPTATVEPTQPGTFTTEVPPTESLTEQAFTTQVPPTEPESNTSNIAPGDTIVSEDFEDNQAQNWTTLYGVTQVVVLPDGNHALQLTQSQFGGVALVYEPSFTWPFSDYTFEADVMVDDPQTGTTNLRLNARIPATSTQEACLGYSTIFGEGWAALTSIGTPNRDCDNDPWQEADLAAEGDAHIEAGAWHHLRLEVQGNNLQYYLDNTQIASANDLNQTWPSGGLGFSAFKTDRTYFDNVTIHRRPQAALAGLDDSNWVVSFGKAFPPNTWPEGSHTYGLTLKCPALGIDAPKETFDFTTSKNQPQPDAGVPLFLTNEGLRDQLIDGSALDSFNPGADILVVYHLSSLTQEQALRAISDCQATLDWSGSSADPLTPIMVFQH